MQRRAEIMTVLELINKAREDNDFDVIGAINVKEYLPINEKREVIGCFQLLLLFFHGKILP